MKFALGKGIDKTDEVKTISRKQVIIATAILGGSLIIAAGTYALVKRSQNARASSEFAGNIEVKRDACKLFNLEDAKKVLGKEAKASPNNANAVSSKATVSTCSYSSGAKNADELIALTVLVRSSNKVQARQAFEVARSGDTEEVKNIGDQAYYSAETSQLNVLKNENWIIIASTKGTSGKGSLDVPKQAADIIMSRF